MSIIHVVAHRAKQLNGKGKKKKKKKRYTSLQEKIRPYPTLSMSCMSLCDTVFPLLCINLLSLLSDDELFDTLCLLCCSSCLSPLSKDFLWVLLLVALCVCDVTWLLLCTPPFCTFDVSMELLLLPERTIERIVKRIERSVSRMLASMRSTD